MFDLNLDRLQISIIFQNLQFKSVCLANLSNIFKDKRKILINFKFINF